MPIATVKPEERVLVGAAQKYISLAIGTEDREIQKRYLEILAHLIRYADHSGAWGDKWGVTLYRYEPAVRLLVGHLIACTIHYGRIWLPGNQKVTDKLPGWEWYEGTYYYQPTPDNRSTWDTLRPDSEKYIDWLSDKYKSGLHGQSKGTHSPCVLAYMEKLLDTKLPRPTHEKETYPEETYQRAVKTAASKIGKLSEGELIPSRIDTTYQRIVRDTQMITAVKEKNNFECQICGHSILLPNGTKYVEAHHIKPLGSPHNGPDIPANVICVCPNHHVELDKGAIRLDLSALRSSDGVGQEFVDYHNSTIYQS